MTTILKVKDLRKEFGGLVAVDNVSFEIQSGEFVGLIGPNGCGKSTTFNCISGLLEKTSGEIEIFGQDITDKTPDKIQKMGLTRTFQHTRLWRRMTVIENLLVPPRNQFGNTFFDKIKSLFRHNIKKLEIGLFGTNIITIPENKSEKNRLIKAFDILDQLEVPHMAHNLTSELSGGQSKLVDIGRSMMGDPKLLLLDEPVAGVAGPLALKIFNNLRNLVNETGVSVLIIEHNMDFILRQGVDRIIVMNEGGVLMEGTPDEVRGNREVIEAYLGSTGEEE
ncbi:MAG: ABC transporter ATP-binding protein [Candidatus Poseidoniales archaeon]|nr:MAG: ABC transporter ATP-binding protein [Candidatus Poseidoniales archaeon]